MNGESTTLLEEF